MRYLFRGLIRENGKAVVGHVESSSPEEAFNALSDNGIVTESLTPDPKPQTFAPRTEAATPFADAIDSAFDTAASQIEFDDLTDRYRGKKVWVIDRDKIRRRVSQVVDQAITQAGDAGGGAALRETVAKAIEGLFKDNSNITSPAHQVAARQQQARLAGPDGDGDPATVAVASSPALDAQVNRLAGLITQAQGVLASISAAARGIGSGGGGGGGGGPRRSFKRASTMKPQNDVLLEIFKSNMALQRGVKLETLPAGTDDGGAPAVDEPAAVEPVAVDEATPVATAETS